MINNSQMFCSKSKMDDSFFSVFEIEHLLLYYERFARLGLIGKYSAEYVGWLI